MNGGTPSNRRSHSGGQSLSAPGPKFSLVEEGDAEYRADEKTKFMGASHVYSHKEPQMSSFNVDINDTGDEVLLDWEQYSRAPKFKLCGREFSVTPPDWWYHLTKGQRRTMITFSVCIVSFTVILLLLMAAAAARYHGSSGSVPHPDNACEWADWRLPNWIQPKAYDLTFEVSMSDPWKVEGISEIDIDVIHQTRCVVLHTKSMSILEARVGGADGPSALNRKYNETYEQLTLEWDESLKAGPHKLYISFQYTLNEGMTGFYRSTYDENGKEYTIASTQFEANSARSAFPCFDEPNYKAVFTVEVITDKDYHVLSNMPPRAVHHHDQHTENAKTWHFLPTPPMSTYLLAIVIGKLSAVTRTIDMPKASVWKSKDYWNLEGGQKRNISVWGIPSQVQNLNYAADAAATIIPFYENALQVAYALPKLDLVAIPNFAAGAMENWGLVTYRQRALLVTPTSSMADKRYVSLIVAHELAHQWFGNLVTMSWWNELWLNEGFASYFEYLGAQASSSDLEFLDNFFMENGPKSLLYDGRNVSHALSMAPHTVLNSATIESIFDAIEYEKGASILRMLRAWVNREASSESSSDHWEQDVAEDGPVSDKFLAGLRNYLVQNSFNNSNAESLWQNVGEEANVELLPLMKEWTFRDGYPVVAVTTDAKGNVKLQQKRFSDQEDIACDTENLWWIPLTFRSSDSASQMKWGELNSCQSLRPLATLPKNGWIKVNANQYGYYRVNYSPPLWDQLKKAAVTSDSNGFPLLNGPDLAGLIEDSFHLAGHDETSIEVFLDLLSSLKTRPIDDASPWFAAIPYIRKIESAVKCKEDWKKFVQEDVLLPFIQNGTLSGNQDFDGSKYFTFISDTKNPVVASPQLQLLRPEIVSISGFFQLDNVKKEAKDLFQDIVAGKSTAIDADMRSPLFITVAKSNHKFPDMINLLKQSKNPDESERIMVALGYYRDSKQVLDLALESFIKPQDMGTLILSVAKNGGDNAPSEALSWIKDNQERIYEKLGTDLGASRKIGQLIERISASIYDAKALQMVLDFMDNQDLISDTSYIERAEATIRSNMAWQENHGTSVCKWIS